MSKQFPEVNSRYGAPMGRSESPLGAGDKNIRLFKVRLDSGGYDDGGAYWGLPSDLWCAQCPDGGQQFVRASNRLVAAVQLGLPNHLLSRGITRDYIKAYFHSWCEGRLPPSLLANTDWEWWFAANGFKVFNGE